MHGVYIKHLLLSPIWVDTKEWAISSGMLVHMMKLINVKF